MFSSIFLKLAAGLTALATSFGLIAGPVAIQPPIEPAPTLEQQEAARDFYRSVYERIDEIQAQLDSVTANFGASIPVVVTSFETSLASGITAAATSMTLVKGTDDAGNTLSGYMCFTVDVNTTKQEFVCGTASSTAITGMIRGIDPQDGDLEVTALKQIHRVGAKVAQTDAPILNILSRILNGDETLPNTLTYANTATSTIVNAGDLVSKAYADALAFGAIPEASLTAGGFSELATQAELASSTEDGSEAVLVAPARWFSSLFSSTTTVPVTNTVGKLAQGFLDLTESFTFSGAVQTTDNSSFAITGTSGETINGATLPVPVYASSTNSRYYAVDGNDTDRLKYVGFAVTNGTASSSIDVKTSGIVNGFTSLSVGSAYYVQDTVGTIATSTGTYPVLVGTAISSTEIEIQKGGRHRIGSITLSDQGADENTTTQTVTLGFRPEKIRARTSQVTSSGSADSTSVSEADGTWINGSYQTLLVQWTQSNAQTQHETDKVLHVYNTSASEQYVVTITSVTDVGFTFSILQKQTSTDSFTVSWEAEGDF